MIGRIVLIGVMVSLALSGGIACRQEIGDDQVVGTWANTATKGYSWKTISLRADGTAELTYWNDNGAGPCTWRLEERRLIVVDRANKELINLNFRLPKASTLVLSGSPKNLVMTGDGKYIRR